MPINSPNNFCFQIIVEPVASLSSSDSFEVIGDIQPIVGNDCNSE